MKATSFTKNATNESRGGVSPAFLTISQPPHSVFDAKRLRGRRDACPTLMAIAAGLLLAGCGTAHDKGPYLPQGSPTPAYENTEPVVLLDPGVQYSVTTTGQPQARTTEDGRLEVIVQLRNRENRRIEVQANCVFKDVNGLTTGDETPFQTVILTENATEQVRFISMNDKARKFTIRVRQAR